MRCACFFTKLQSIFPISWLVSWAISFFFLKMLHIFPIQASFNAETIRQEAFSGISLYISGNLQAKNSGIYYKNCIHFFNNEHPCDKEDIIFIFVTCFCFCLVLSSSCLNMQFKSTIKRPS